MKMILNLKKVFKIFFLPLLLMLSTSCILSQEKKETEYVKEFLVIVEHSDSNKIKLQCKEGCAWKKLTFSLSEDSKTQLIDEYGMTDIQSVNSKKSKNLSNFLFTVKKIDNTYKLKGVEGTAWTDLTFSILPNRKQAVNKLGMTEY